MSSIESSNASLSVGKRMSRPSRSLKVYLGIVVALVATHIVLAVLPVTHVMQAQSALSSWPAVAAFTLLGLAGVWLAGKSGFAGMWDEQVSTWQRLGLPASRGDAEGDGDIGVRDHAVDQTAEEQDDSNIGNHDSEDPPHSRYDAAQQAEQEDTDHSCQGD